MRKVLLIGAGKSSWYLIDYLLRLSQSLDFRLVICEQHIGLISSEFDRNLFDFTSIDIHNNDELHQLLKDKFIVISMLPAFLHPLIARACLVVGAHFSSASYASEEMKGMAAEVERKGLIFLNECGLDPGIDHMSAMEIIDNIHAEGGIVTSFRSYCGGLIAPAYNDNPWGYKFSWNPRNVVLAGQGTAKYLDEGKLKLLPYSRLFKKIEHITLPDGTSYEGYPNRDSISYKEVYGLQKVKTMIRGTLRMPGYCESWDKLVNLGLTDDSYQVVNQDIKTYRDLVDSLLPESNERLESRFCRLFNLNEDSDTFKRIVWTGVMDEIPLSNGQMSPAAHLQILLEDKWRLQSNDRDLVVMQHIFDYKLNDADCRIHSSLYLEGVSSLKTAMAKTVGLPLAMAVERILQGSFSKPGVHLPLSKELYGPILEQLKLEGVEFIHQYQKR
jgi:saccharopine dehydrogenase (NADP+, L-glutamate forming)